VAALSQPSAPANVPATLGVLSTAVLNAPLASTASEASSATRGPDVAVHRPPFRPNRIVPIAPEYAPSAAEVVTSVRLNLKRPRGGQDPSSPQPARAARKASSKPPRRSASAEPDKRITCQYCHTSLLRSNASRHKEACAQIPDRPNRKPWTCSICHKDIPRLDNYVEHVRSHKKTDKQTMFINAGVADVLLAWVRGNGGVRCLVTVRYQPSSFESALALTTAIREVREPRVTSLKTWA